MVLRSLRGSRSSSSIEFAIKGLDLTGIDLNVRDLGKVEIFADPLFQKVFFNLIDNSLKYGGEKMKNIKISSHESDNRLVIVCEDNGLGISLKEKELIFKRGYGKNTGLGLFLIQEILAITGITIKETGEPGKGARFEILVPKESFRK